MRSVVRVLALLLAVGVPVGCAGAAPPTPSPARAATFDEFTTSACAAFEALFRAVGNPDSGAQSEAYKSLDQAAKAHDLAGAERFAAIIRSDLDAVRANAAIAAGWPPGAPMMAGLDGVAVAYGANVDAIVEQARGRTGGLDPQAAFEQARGVEAWTAMLAGSRELGAGRPAGEPPRRCGGIPVSL